MEEKTKIEEIELAPSLGGKKQTIRIISQKVNKRESKIHWIDIEDPDIGIISLSSVNFIELIKRLSSRNFEGFVENLIMR